MNNTASQIKKPANSSVSGKFDRPFLKFLLFIFFFFFAIYFLFPYSILRYYIESQIQTIFTQQNILIDAKIRSSRPYWLTGIQLKDISIHSIYDNKRTSFDLHTFSARVSILPLLIGRIHVNATLQQKNAGNLKLFVSLPLSVLFDMNNLNQYELEAQFQHFDLQGLTDQILGIVENSSNPALALVNPVIAVTSFGGYLNGTIKMNEHSKTRQGFANINFDKFYLFVNDPSLNIPKQLFKQASLLLEWDHNATTIHDQTVFESENFYLKPKGLIKTATPVHVIDLGVLLILSGSIEKNFGFLLPQLLKCPSNAMIDGVMNVKLVGPTSHYQCE